MPRKPLNAKHAKRDAFVAEYTKDFNATQAAIRAGYSPKTARQQGEQLLSNLDIQRAIAETIEARKERIEIDVAYVVNGAREVFERCLQKRPVLTRIDGEWVQATDEHGRDVWQFDAKGANGALGILAKHVRLGGPDVAVNIDLDKLTPAQLEHIANGGSLASLPVG